MKATKFSLFGLLALFLVFTACEDDFSEQDLLQLQAELAETKAQNDFERRLQELAAMAEDAQELATLNDALSRATSEYMALLYEALQDEDDSLAAANALAALRAAGFVTQFDVDVVANDVPLSGIAISLTTQGGTTLNDTTDADGIVNFVDVPVGSNDIALSGTNYLPIDFTVTFNAPDANDFIDINGVDVGIPKSGRATVNMVASGSITGAATIAGTAEGDVDLTDDGDELLQGVIVSASINTIAGSSGAGADNQLVSITGEGTRSDVRFAIDGFSMTDTTDASGEYSFMVPASEDITFNYTIAFSEQITSTQYMASVDDNGTANIVGVDAIWGIDDEGSAISNANNTSDADVPDVNGYQVDLASAPEYGTGFAIAITDTIERSLNEGNLETLFGQVAGTRSQLSNDGTNTTHIGTLDVVATYATSTPTATLSGGTGTAAVLNMQQDYDFTPAAGNSTVALTTASGTRYNAGNVAVGEIYLQIIGNDQNNKSDVDTLLVALQTLTDNNGDQIFDATDATGAVFPITLNGAAYNVFRSNDAATTLADDETLTFGTSTITYTDDAGGNIDLSANPSIDGDYDLDITSISVIFAEESANVLAASPGAAPVFTETQNISTSNVLINGSSSSLGSYRTGPSTLTLSNGLQVTFGDMAFRYEFEINNASASGYEVVPANIDHKGTQYDGASTTSTTVNTYSNVESYNGATQVDNNAAIETLLTVTNDTLTPYNVTIDEFRTEEFFVGPPSLVAVADGTTDHSVNAITINASGTITAITFTAGAGYNSSFNSIAISERTLGSISNPDTIDLTPTTAASISVSDTEFTTDVRTKLATWTGTASLDNGGEGYREFINDEDATEDLDIVGDATAADATSTTISVAPGTTYNVRINYGRGKFVDEELTLNGDM